MRLTRFLWVLGLVTFLALIYVYQQTEVFRLAYVGQKKMVVCQDLLDKNTLLRYNIDRNASLVRLGNNILRSSEFQMPSDYRLMKLASFSGVRSAHQQATGQESILSRIFGIRRQAEAKTLNSQAASRANAWRSVATDR